VAPRAFQALSILTSTGYASADFALWSERSQALLLVVAFIGGSAGSAAGGVKVARWVILVQHTSREVRRSLHPRAVLPVRMGRRVVPEDVLRSVAAFITLYVTLFAIATVALVLLGSRTSSPPSRRRSPASATSARAWAPWARWRTSPGSTPPPRRC
jgi:trk system potassium uptake protein